MPHELREKKAKEFKQLGQETMTDKRMNNEFNLIRTNFLLQYFLTTFLFCTNFLYYQKIV